MNLSPGQALVRWCHQNGERASLLGQGYLFSFPHSQASPRKLPQLLLLAFEHPEDRWLKSR